jgi:hypothetical protein
MIARVKKELRKKKCHERFDVMKCLFGNRIERDVNAIKFYLS